jgi:hypothetical protein
MTTHHPGCCAGRLRTWQLSRSLREFLNAGTWNTDALTIEVVRTGSSVST